MDQRLSLVTLGVADISRAREFYERLGWRGQEVDETVFFQAGSIGIVLWGRDKLAEDSGVDDPGGGGFGGSGGATITRPPGPTFYGGYAGCFTDPDGHVWEIAYNPGFPLDDDGAVTIPDFGGGD